jgi:hypothetical protein
LAGATEASVNSTDDAYPIRQDSCSRPGFSAAWRSVRFRFERCRATLLALLRQRVRHVF